MVTQSARSTVVVDLVGWERQLKMLGATNAMFVKPSAAGCDTPVGSDSLEARSKDGTKVPILARAFFVSAKRSNPMATTTDEYIRLKDAPRLLGVHPGLLTRRIRAGELENCRDPRDRRHLLVRRSDLEMLLTPGGGRSNLAVADRAAELATV